MTDGQARNVFCVGTEFESLQKREGSREVREQPKFRRFEGGFERRLLSLTYALDDPIVHEPFKHPVRGRPKQARFSRQFPARHSLAPQSNQRLKQLDPWRRSDEPFGCWHPL